VLGYQYDANRQLTNRWSAAKGNTAYRYDTAGNLTSVTYPSSYGITNQYDALNRRTNMVDAAGTTKMTYNSAGDLATEDGPWASDTATFTYDSNVPHLRLGLSLQQPSGSWTNGFSYDYAGRLTSVTAPAGTFTYTYNGPSGIWTNLALPPSGSHVARALDTVARLKSTALLNSGGSTLNYHGYTNNVGNQRIAQVRGDSSYAAYSYDDDGQLKSAVGASGQSQMNLGYAYDAAWNLNRRTNNGTPTSFTVDNLNQLTAGPTSPYTNDNNGNLTGQVNYYAYGYSYDDEDQLTSVIFSGISKSDFKYDGLGRLRQRQEYTWYGYWALSSTVNYVYDGRRVIQERDGNNTPTVSYTRGSDLAGSLEGAGGIGGLLARSHGYSGGSWSTHNYYHADGGGNVTYIMDASQAVAATYRYDPFGKLLYSSGSLASANLYRFSSKEFHSASSLYYYGFRFYDPNLQRWINRDPLGEAGGLNLYAFVRNNSIYNVDLLGLKPRGGLVPEGEITREILCWTRSGGRYWNGRYMADRDFERLAEQIERNTRTVAENYESQPPYFGNEPAFRPLIPRNCPSKGGVYGLSDPLAGIIVRTGRTFDFERRQNEHADNPILSPYRFEILYPTENYAEQRGLEQFVHWRFNPPFNYINPIGPRNINRYNYIHSATIYLNHTPLPKIQISPSSIK
jgi:RHS repeat-associated protein